MMVPVVTGCDLARVESSAIGAIAAFGCGCAERGGDDSATVFENSVAPDPCDHLYVQWIILAALAVGAGV